MLIPLIFVIFKSWKFWVIVLALMFGSIVFAFGEVAFQTLATVCRWMKNLLDWFGLGKGITR